MSVPPTDLPARDIDNLLLCASTVDAPIEYVEVRVEARVGSDCSILDPHDFFRDLEPHLAKELDDLLGNDLIPRRSKIAHMSEELIEDLMYGCAGSASLNTWVTGWATLGGNGFALRKVCDLRLGQWKLMHTIVANQQFSPIQESDLHLVKNLAGWLERECRVYSLSNKRDGINLALICRSQYPSPYVTPESVARSQINILSVTPRTYPSR